MIDFKPVEIRISPIPKHVTDINPEPNQCIKNAADVAKKHEETYLVEGVLLISDKENKAKALAHALNMEAEKHFDVTSMIWTGSGNHSEIASKKYLPLKGYKFKELTGDVFTFAEETIKEVNEMNEALLLKFPYGTEVILRDPYSNKFVNYGVIKDYDKSTSNYIVSIVRYENQFDVPWFEGLIDNHTIGAYRKMEENIAKVEFACDHLVAGIDNKFKQSTDVLEIPASIYPHTENDKFAYNYILYYTRMNIDGQKLWRLLTYREMRIEVKLDE